jgi:hypothetical protein
VTNAVSPGLLGKNPPFRTLIFGGIFYSVVGLICVWLDERAFAAGFPNEPLYWLHLALFSVQSLLGLMIVFFLVVFAALKICIEIIKVVMWLRCDDARTQCEFSDGTTIGLSESLLIAWSVAGSVPMLWPLARMPGYWPLVISPCVILATLITAVCLWRLFFPRPPKNFVP